MNYLAFRASSSIASNITITWPDGYGSAGDALMTDNSGNLYWGTPTGAGTIQSGATGQFPYYASGGTILTATSTLYLANTGYLGIGTTAPMTKLAVVGDLGIHDQNDLRLYEQAANGLNYTALRATGTLGGNVILTLPSSYGSAGNALLTDNSGNLYWGDPTGAGTNESGIAGQFAYYAANGNTISGTSTIIIKPTGSVGIGTSSPWKEFAVSGTGAFSDGLCIGGACITNWGAAGLGGTGSGGQIAYWANSNTLAGTSTLAVSTGGTGRNAWSQYAIPYLTNTNQFGEVAIGSPNQVMIVNPSGTGYAWTSTSTWDTSISLGAQYSPAQSGLTQILATSTAGTDFAIISNANTHTFYLPSASAANRGLLTPADWSSFNGKWDALADIGLTAGNFIVGNASGAGEATSTIHIAPNLNVGIGTSSPWKEFAVSGTGAFSDGLCIGSDCISNWGSAGFSGSGIAGQLAYWTDTNALAATSTINVNLGGTGRNAWSQYAIPYLTNTNQFGEVAIGSPNQVMIVNPSGTGYAWTSTSTWDTSISLGAQYSPAQSGLTQILATSTAGTDFAIVSNANTHTFYLPSASAANRGLLTPADWSSFNGKWDALADIGLTAGNFIVGNASGAGEATSTIHIAPNLNVGIGTSSPWKEFAVSGTGAFSDGLCIGSDCISNWGSAGFSGSGIAGQLAYWTDTNALAATSTINVNLGGTGRNAWSQYAIPYLTNTNQFGEVAIGSPNQVMIVNPSGTGYAWTSTSTWDTSISLGAQYSPAQSGLTQILATSTAGTDFAIVSNANTHTFYLPSASAANRGLLTPADWSSFNGKWDALADIGLTAGNLIVGNASGAGEATSTIHIAPNLNVGIGTSSPWKEFAVSGTGAFSDGLCIGSDCISNWGSAGFSGSGIAGQLAYWTDTNALAATSTINVNLGGTGRNAWSQYAIPYLTNTNQFGEVAIGSPNQVMIVNPSGTGYAWTSTSTWDTSISLGAQYSPAQSGLTQILATSTAGTDFAIVSNANTHTFYLPSASAANRGLLTPADWSSFNGKWDALADIGLTAGNFIVGNASGAGEATSTIHIAPNLNVGIGTSSPWKEFAVSGTGAFSDGLCIGGACITNWGQPGSAVPAQAVRSPIGPIPIL